MLRILSIVFLVSLLQACGLADRFFTTNECEGDNCEAPVLLDNSNPDQKWYCYGKSQDEQWQCQNTPDPSQVTSVQPAPTPARAERPKALTQAQPPAILTPPQPPKTVKVPESTAMPELTATAEKILNSPADHYAVQLVALREISGIREYAGLNGIDDPQVVKIRSDDSDWHILLLGIYENKALAEAAKNEWSTAKVLRVQPWIRKLAGIQEAIRATQR